LSDYVDPFPDRPKRSNGRADLESRGDAPTTGWPDAALQDLLADVLDPPGADLEETP